MTFSKTDKNELLEEAINGQLAVSDRSCIRMFRRMGDSFGIVSTIEGTCTETLPEPEDEEDDEDEGSQE